MRILLIEDEKRMAEALMEILRLEKYEVDCFSNGFDGLTAIESVAFEKWLMLHSDITDGIGGLGDSTKLKQVVSILLDNAIRHSFC